MRKAKTMEPAKVGSSKIGRFNFLIKADERKLLDELAEAAGVSASDILRLALREFAKKRKAA